MKFLEPYRRVLATPGARAFWLPGLIGRLPLSMTGIGIVMLVQRHTGSYGMAGAVTAVATITEASTALIQGRLIDRFGQRAVLMPVGVLFALTLALTVTSVQADWPKVLVYICAGCAGLTIPQISSSVRARWAYLWSQHVATLDPAVPVEKGAPNLQTAYALESMGDEVVFMVGPIVMTILGAALHPIVGLAVALVAGTVGTLLFASQRATQPNMHEERAAGRVREPVPWRTMVPLIVSSFGLGIVFGGIEVATVAYTQAHHVAAVGGVVLATWSVGSLCGALIVGALHWHASARRRIVMFCTAMAVFMSPLAFAGHVWMLVPILVLSGLPIAPAMVAGAALTEESVPPSRLTEGMALITTAVVGGVAPGAWLTGIVVDHHGASNAYWVDVIAAAAAALAAALLPRLRSTLSPRVD